MMRIGQSIDIHQLVEGRKLILGGVEIPFELGLKGIVMQMFCCMLLLKVSLEQWV